MKAILAVTCFLSAVVLISALDKEVCEGPHALSSCDTNAPLGDWYYFNNGTGRCERVFGCGGPNEFPTEDRCREECPYGTYASNV
uniref:Putative salivary kunitz domain protein n=1 Tax=Ixodes ricinus TaxID=34613 RepID=A0A0K8R4D4_IXORI